jgi:Stress responsive A/B Barrel Domain
MFNVTRLIDVAAPDLAAVLDAVRTAAAATGASHRLVEPTLPGARNGGDILAHLRFADEIQWCLAAEDFNRALADRRITRINGASYTGSATSNNDGAPTVYRALLLRVLPQTSPATVQEFERDLLSMPRYVPDMTAWQLSRVAEPVGATPWTHVFEQEFTSVGGLLGPYLMHPIHWAVVDRWFDPECPEVIIRDRVCHSFCELPSPVLG